MGATIVKVAKVMLRPWGDTDWEGGRENEMQPLCEQRVTPRGKPKRWCRKQATHIRLVAVDGEVETGEFLCTVHARQAEQAFDRL